MKKTPIALAIALGISFGACATAPNSNTYPKAAYVVALNYKNDVVTVEDATGNRWDFYGCEDYYEGDIVAMTMSDNGTPDNIYDDIIINARFSGLWQED